MLLKFRLDKDGFRFTNPADLIAATSIDYIKCHFDIADSVWNESDAIIAVFKSATYNKHSEVLLDSYNNCYIDPEVYKRGGTIQVKLIGDKYSDGLVISSTTITSVLEFNINENIIIPLEAPSKYSIAVAELEKAKSTLDEALADLAYKLAHGELDGVGIERIVYNLDGTVTITLSDGTVFTSEYSMKGATGNSGVYYGPDEPTDPDIFVWVNPDGEPTFDPLYEIIDTWMEAHPEATTTVLDGSLTESKFADSLKLKTIKDYVTPEMYGAKGDGVTDDTDAVESAFLNSYVLCKNKYKITRRIEINNDIYIFGTGEFISFASETNASLFAFNTEIGIENVKNVVIDGISISCPSESLQPTVPSASDHSAISGSTCSNVIAFAFLNGIKNVRVQNVYITNMYESVFYNGDADHIGKSLIVDNLIDIGFAGTAFYCAFCENVSVNNCLYEPNPLCVNGAHLFYINNSIKQFVADNIKFYGGQYHTGAIHLYHTGSFDSEVFEQTFVTVANSYIRSRTSVAVAKKNVDVVLNNVRFEYYQLDNSVDNGGYVVLGIGTANINFNRCEFFCNGEYLPPRFINVNSVTTADDVINVYLNDCDVDNMINLQQAYLHCNFYIKGCRLHIEERILSITTASSFGEFIITGSTIICDKNNQISGTQIGTIIVKLINNFVKRLSGQSVFNASLWNNQLEIYNSIFEFPVRQDGVYFDAGTHYNNIVVNGAIYGSNT